MEKIEMMDGWDQKIIKRRKPKQTIMTFKRNNNNAHIPHKPHTENLLMLFTSYLICD